MNIVINQEICWIRRIDKNGYLPEVETDSGDFLLAESSESAGEKAREYWADMVENDPQEFTCMVGEETLLKWALGQFAGPGSTQVQSLEEWLDLWLDTPEEQWASYDGEEREVLNYEEFCAQTGQEMEEGEEDSDKELLEELGFIPTVAYRSH